MKRPGVEGNEGIAEVKRMKLSVEEAVVNEDLREEHLPNANVSEEAVQPKRSRLDDSEAEDDEEAWRALE